MVEALIVWFIRLGSTIYLYADYTIPSARPRVEPKSQHLNIMFYFRSIDETV